jgi:glutathione peroxidase
MRAIRTELAIEAPAGTVWNVLTDFARYPEWNPFLVRVETELVPGAAVAMTVRLGRRVLPLRARMLAVEPGREFRWAGPLARWQGVVFRGEHFFGVEPLGPASCRFLHGEDFGGLSLPLIDRWMRRALLPPYEAMNHALARRAESLAAGLAADRRPGDRSTMTFYDLKTQRLDGSPADLGEYRGKVTLVVNVASECGFTPQYAGLEKLHGELAGEGFAVLGFPSNEFGGQEPGSAEEIKAFCERNYGVSFPLFAKGETKPGAGQSPVYAFLTKTGDVPSWNFCKYLVGKDGEVKAFFPSNVAPEDRRLRQAVNEALAA